MFECYNYDEIFVLTNVIVMQLNSITTKGQVFKAISLVTYLKLAFCPMVTFAWP